LLILWRYPPSFLVTISSGFTINSASSMFFVIFLF
jgi:hypothetical protein